jgi:hypothetical protein
MLRMPLADHLKQPLSVLVTWISIAQPAFDEAFISADSDIDLEDDLDFELDIA